MSDNRRKRLAVIETTILRNPKARGVDIAKFLKAYMPDQPDQRSLETDISAVRRRHRRGDNTKARVSDSTKTSPTPGMLMLARALAAATSSLSPGARLVAAAVAQAKDRERQFADGLARAQSFARVGPYAATARFALVPPLVWVFQEAAAIAWR